jgi:hypothetical protein
MDNGDIWALTNKDISMQNNPSLERFINNKTKTDNEKE